MSEQNDHVTILTAKTSWGCTTFQTTRPLTLLLFNSCSSSSWQYYTIIQLTLACKRKHVCIDTDIIHTDVRTPVLASTQARFLLTINHNLFSLLFYIEWNATFFSSSFKSANILSLPFKFSFYRKRLVPPVTFLYSTFCIRNLSLNGLHINFRCYTNFWLLEFFPHHRRFIPFSMECW